MSATPHRCPICSGSGQMDGAFYSGSITTFVGSVACRACSGQGIVWEPFMMPRDVGSGSISYAHPPANNRTNGCLLSGPGRGDCVNFVGLPGPSIPGQHDGEDDTLDVYGKPNGWCVVCWGSEQQSRLHAEVARLHVELRRIRRGPDPCSCGAKPGENHREICSASG